MVEPRLRYGKPDPAVVSFVDSSDADDGNGNVTFMSAPVPVTVTSVAFRFVVFRSAEDDADADAEELLPFDVPDVLEQAETAKTKAGIVLMAAIRANFEVTASAYRSIRSKSCSYMPAISFVDAFIDMAERVYTEPSGQPDR